MLRAFERSDVPAILELWNRRWGNLFPLDEALWVQQTIGDPLHFRPDLARVAQVTGKAGMAYVEGQRIVGAVSLKTPPNPVTGGSWVGQNPKNAWISFVLVEPGREADLGPKLLEYALEALRREGFEWVQYGGDPSHFFPGVPREDSGLAELLQGYGFEKRKTEGKDRLEQDLIRDLSDYQLPEEARAALQASGLADDAQRNTRLETKSCTREDVPGLLDFLAENFPGRWLYDTQERLKVEPTPADILVLKGQGRIWGFCHLYHAGSRRIGPGIYWRKALGPGYGGLGPIGVSRDLRGRGLGFALLCYGVQRLKELGVQRMVIDWTTLADFYGKIGFKPWRSYLAYSRKL